MRRMLPVLLVLAFAPMASGREFKQLMKKGDGADLVGKTKKAASRYQAAVEAAILPEQRVEALLALVDALRGGAVNAGLDDATAAQIEAAYKRALTEATGKASFSTHFDYGTFLLDRGDAAAAAAIFADGEKDLGSVEASPVARYLYNFALARLRADHVDEAFAAFRAAIEKDPSFALAAEATFSVATRFEAPRAAHEAVSLIELLVENNRFAQAEKFLHTAMENEGWYGQSAEMKRLLELFVRWAVRAETPNETIVNEWLPRLKHLAHELGDEAEHKADQLVLVFRGKDLPMSFDGNVERHFSRWSSNDERHNLSLLLRMSANAAELDNQPGRAAERYIASWKLDRANIDALVQLSWLLTVWKDDDSPKLFDRLLDELFERKGLAIASDTAAVLRLHMVLGSIFEAKERWGPESNPRSATFQYAAALRNYEALRQKPDTPIYPGVHANLAAAYEHAGDNAKAWTQYVAAAEAHLQTGQFDAAAVMLDRCNALAYTPGDDEKTRMQKVTSAVIAAKAPAPANDAGIARLVRDRLSADPTIDFSKLDVTVTDGVVLVQGEIASQQQADHARAAVLRAEGVKDVRVDVTLPTPP